MHPIKKEIHEWKDLLNHITLKFYQLLFVFMPIFSKNFIKIYLVDRQIIAEKNKQTDGCNDRQMDGKTQKQTE